MPARPASSRARRWFKRLKILARLALLNLGLDKRAVFGVLTVNGSCNFSCHYCFADYYLKKDEALPLERMLKTIDEMREIGVVYLNVHGGEALLRRDIGDILDHALRRGFFVNLITNGTLVVKRWEQIRGVDTMVVSLDGRPENNDLNRGRGTAAQALRAIEFARSQGMTVRVGMTITKHTMGDLDWMMEWAKTNDLQVHPFLLFDQESLPEHLWMTPHENRAALAKLLDFKKRGYPVLYSEETLKYALEWPYEKAVLDGKDLAELKENGELRPDFKLVDCSYKKYNVLSENNGTVRTCNILARKSYHASYLDGKTLGEAKRELHANEDCRHCYHLPQTEISQLMQLRMGPLIGQFVSQFVEEIIRRPRRVRGDTTEVVSPGDSKETAPEPAPEHV